MWIHADWDSPMIYVIVELSFGNQISAVQRHLSITEMEDWDLVTDSTDWKAAHLVATNVKGEKKEAPITFFYMTLSFTEGRIEWDLMNLKVEHLIRSDTKDFICCLHFLSYKREKTASFWEVHLFGPCAFVTIHSILLYFSCLGFLFSSPASLKMVPCSTAITLI